MRWRPLITTPAPASTRPGTRGRPYARSLFLPEEEDSAPGRSDSLPAADAVAPASLLASGHERNEKHMIEAEGLTERYGRTVAVDGIDFQVKPGVVTA